MTKIKYEEDDIWHKYSYGKPAEIVQWLLTQLGVTEFEDRVDKPKDYGKSSKFDQEEIVETLADIDFEDTDMKEYGKIYVPTPCLTEQCHVHFAFHGSGCADLDKRQSQYNHFAASNNVIMVYPRTSAIWDNYGDVDPDNYMNRDGVYPRIMMAMLARLGEGCPEEEQPSDDGAGGEEPPSPPPVVDEPCLDDEQKEALRTGLTTYGTSLQGFFDAAQAEPWTENYMHATADDLRTICLGAGLPEADQFYCLIGLDTY